MYFALQLRLSRLTHRTMAHFRLLDQPIELVRHTVRQLHLSGTAKRFMASALPAESFEMWLSPFYSAILTFIRHGAKRATDGRIIGVFSSALILDRPPQCWTSTPRTLYLPKSPITCCLKTLLYSQKLPSNCILTDQLGIRSWRRRDFAHFSRYCCADYRTCNISSTISRNVASMKSLVRSGNRR